MLETNGDHASTPSEINLNAVHAGPSDLLKLFQTDSVLLQVERLTLFFPHKIWSHATRTTTDVKVVILTSPGLTSSPLVPSPKVVTHTSPNPELPQLARPPRLVTMEAPGLNTSATPLFTQPQLKTSRRKSIPTVPSKPDSPSTKISTTTRVESITTQPDLNSVVTPSRSSDTEMRTEWTTGSVPTHGDPHGECQDTSRSSTEIAQSTNKCTVALQHSEYHLENDI